MGNILTVDGTFREERENCLQGHKWTFTVKTCSLNSPIIFLHGKWLVKLQWKILPVWELGHETSVSCIYRPVPDECHELMIGGSIFFEIEWQRVSGKYWKVWRKNGPFWIASSLLRGCFLGSTVFKHRTANVFVVSEAAIWSWPGAPSAFSMDRPKCGGVQSSEGPFLS